MGSGRSGQVHSRVLTDPAPTVLLDCNSREGTLETAVAFFTAEDEAAAVKSDLIQTIDAAVVGAQFGTRRDRRCHRPRGSGYCNLPPQELRSRGTLALEGCARSVTRHGGLTVS